jgi:hypothetical protein
VLGILVCCLLGSIKPQKWHLIGFSMITVVFFFYLNRDTATISRMEDQLDDLVGNLPPGQRVVGTIETFPSANVGTDHIIDRACIAHCFSYLNYEPKVAQFRVRANPGNPFVVTDYQTILEGQTNNYIVQARDLPLFEIQKCASSGTALCVRELAAGDRTALAVKLNRAWVARFNRLSLLFGLLLVSILAAAALVWRSRIGSHKQATV